MKKIFCCYLSFLLLSIFSLGAETLYLINNLKQAQTGDWIVINSFNSNTLMCITAKLDNYLLVEEISIPSNLTPPNINWQNWAQNQAPGNNSWLRYEIDLQTGRIGNLYSVSKGCNCSLSEVNSFLSTMLSLPLSKIADSDRKRVGRKVFSSRDGNTWQPKLKVNGCLIKGAKFDAFKGTWPADGSELAHKTIEIYLPAFQYECPNYFPYWIQVQAIIGKGYARIIDSGKQMNFKGKLS